MSNECKVVVKVPAGGIGHAVLTLVAPVRGLGSVLTIKHFCSAIRNRAAACKAQ